MGLVWTVLGPGAVLVKIVGTGVSGVYGSTYIVEESGVFVCVERRQFLFKSGCVYIVGSDSGKVVEGVKNGEA